MIGPIHHVTLSVHDLERSVAFYRDVLGFRPTLSAVVDDEEHRTYLRLARGVVGRAVIMQAEGAITGSVELIHWADADGASPNPSHPPKRPGDPGVCLLAFEVTDEGLREVYDRLVAHGIECWSEPVAMHIEGYGEIAAVVFEDPDGVMIELLTLPSLEEARRARREWQQAMELS